MSRHWRYRASAALALALFCGLSAALDADKPAHAEPSQVTLNREQARKVFSDREILDGFFLTALGAEFHVAGRVDRIRKFDRPVRVHIDERGKPDRRTQIGAVVTDIRDHIQHLDIATTAKREDANLFVTIVRQRDFARTLRELFGRERARDLLRRLQPQCISGFSKDDELRIVRADVVLVSNVDDFTFRDCAYEELLQALGPINDTDKIPWTMFNDDVQMGFFDVYDQYLLNILYDPRVRPGMTADDVRARLPEIMPDVRDWVARINGLPPPKP